MTREPIKFPAIKPVTIKSLAILALLAVVAAAATWPPVRAAARFAVERTTDAYQAKYLDSQSARFLCM